MSRLFNGSMGLCLALALGAAGLPAEASEVVKLARLVVSGKRSTAEAPRSPAPENRPAAAGSQSQGAGGSDDSGTAPTPARGVS